MLEVQELREKINKLGTDEAAMMAKAKEEKRELTKEEEEKFDKMDAERESYLAQERRLKALESISGTSQPDDRRDRVQPTTQPFRTAETRIDAQTSKRDHSLMLRGHFDPDFVQTDAHRDAAKRLGLSTRGGNKFYVALPERALKSTQPEDIRSWEDQFTPRVYAGNPSDFSIRDLAAGATVGSYVVQPSEMLRALEVALLQYGGMREVATIVRTDTGVPLPFPTMNDTSNKGAILAEAAQDTTELDPTFAQTVLHAFTYTSKKVYVSVEFMQDNAINFEARIGEILGTRIARILNDHFTTGAGTTLPFGIVTQATSSGITTASPTAVTYQELMNLEHAVDPAYRTRGANGAKWMFADSALLAIKKIMVPHFSGDTGGYPLWRPGLTVSEPDTIDGYTYVINQSMPALAATNKAILFGMLSKYQIRDVRMIEIVRLNELRAEYRQVEWFAFYRGDGNLLDAGTHPVMYLTQHA
jgi:HK97 family phage major capsid protein